MKILVIGGNGTIGKTIVNHYKKDHEVIIGGRNSGDVNVDIANKESLQNMFEKIGKLDAIVCAAGEAKWDDFNKLSEDDFYIGIRSKLMGQVNLVRLGQHYLNAEGSITLTTGILADHPVKMTTSAAMVNGAIHSFVQAVALDLKHDIRVNVASVGLVQDAYEKYKDYFVGHTPVSMEKVIATYRKSVEGKESGVVYREY